MSQTIAITGATGELGRLTITALRERIPANRIVALARDPEKAKTLPADVTVRIADNEDPTALRAALDGVDTVLLISGNEFGKRMQQHRNVIAAAQERGVTHFAYTSAPHASTSNDFITREHRETEAIIRESGLPHTILRMNSYHENYLGALHEARETGELVGSVHSGRVASAAKRDFAEAAAIALISPSSANTVYELTGDTAWNYDELAKAMSAVLDRPVTYRDLTTDEHRELLISRGLDPATTDFLTQLDADLARGVSAEVTTDLRTLINRPTTPLLDGLRSAWRNETEVR